MTRRLVFHPDLEAEVVEAASWYEQQTPGSAARFSAAFRSALTKVTDNPLQYQIIEDGMRRAPIGRYPYGLLYVASDDEIAILSCFHGKRDPAKRRERLKR